MIDLMNIASREKSILVRNQPHKGTREEGTS